MIQNCPLCGKRPLPDGLKVCRACAAAAFADAVEDEGFCIPGYRDLKLLSQGGMGAVYQAWQEQPERMIAVKVLHTHLADDLEMRMRFHVEAHAMAALHHPGVLPVYEAGEVNGMLYFSMKFLGGGNLAQKIAQGPMPAREAASIISVVARALHYAHQQGVLHRDIKPENILFDDSAHPVLGDFGLAKLTTNTALAGNLTRSESFFGTPHYMPPEVAMGKVSTAGSPADIYSLGAVLYACLTGRKPFANQQNLASLLHAIANDSIPTLTPQQAPRDLAVICAKAMDKSPPARFSTAGEFADELDRWLSDRPILSRPVGKAETLWRWAKREPLAAALAASLLLTVLIAATALIFNYRQRGKLLQESLLNQARSERLLSHPGHRETCLRLLRQAKDLGDNPSLRLEAAALLTQPDLAEIESEVAPPTSQPIWPPALSDNEPVTEKLEFAASQPWTLTLHAATGRAAAWQAGAPRPQRIWEPQPVGRIFAAGGKNAFLGGTTQGLLRFENPNQDPTVLAPPGAPLTGLALAPDESRLAVASGEGLRLISAADGNSAITLTSEHVRCPPVWSADGQIVAAAVGEGREVACFRVSDPTGVTRISTNSWVKQLARQPQGTLLGIACGDQSLTLGAPETGLVWATVAANENPDSTLRFSEDGQELSFGGSRWRIAPPCGFRVWFAPTGKNETAFSLSVSPTGRWLFSTSTSGVRVWDTNSGRLAGFHPVENQLIDAPTTAWWLDETHFLVQVPGGLETVPITAAGEPQKPIQQPRKPGSRILEVRKNGDWLVETVDGEEKLVRERWLGGNPEKATPDSSEIPPESTVPMLSLHGLTLTPPQGQTVIATTSRGDLLFALTTQHQILEWDATALEKGLRQEGF